jgi:hypothetical protein
MFDPLLIPDGYHLDVRPGGILVVNPQGDPEYVIEDDRLVPYREWHERAYGTAVMSAVVTNPPGYKGAPDFDAGATEFQVETYGLDPEKFRFFLGTDPPVVVFKETGDAAYRYRGGTLEPVA